MHGSDVSSLNGYGRIKSHDLPESALNSGDFIIFSFSRYLYTDAVYVISIMEKYRDVPDAGSDCTISLVVTL